MRELNEHKINPADDTLTIEVVDEPGATVTVDFILPAIAPVPAPPTEA